MQKTKLHKVPFDTISIIIVDCLNLKKNGVTTNVVVELHLVERKPPPRPDSPLLYSLTDISHRNKRDFIIVTLAS